MQSRKEEEPLTSSVRFWCRALTNHFEPASQLGAGTEKRATKNEQLVLQHCCKMSWIAMICCAFYHPRSNLLTWFVARQVLCQGGKTRNIVIQLPLHYNVAKQVARFLLTVLRVRTFSDDRLCIYFIIPQFKSMIFIYLSFYPSILWCFCYSVASEGNVAFEFRYLSKAIQALNFAIGPV